MDAASPAEERPGIWKEVLSGAKAHTIIGADIVSVWREQTSLFRTVID
jgi:hypothetical protein